MDGFYISNGKPFGSISIISHKERPNDNGSAFSGIPSFQPENYKISLTQSIQLKIGYIQRMIWDGFVHPCLFQIGIRLYATVCLLAGNPSAISPAGSI